MDDKTIAYIAIVAIVAVVFIIYFITSRTSNPGAGKNKGKDYKIDRASDALRSFARSNDYLFLAPVDLGQAHIDAVAIGDFGLLGVKGYGYNKEIYGDAGEEEWLRVGFGAVREHFPNPVNEANQSVQALREVLQDAKIKAVPVDVVAVFTNPKVEMAAKKVGQLTMPEFKALLEKSKYLQDKGVEPGKVKAAIEAAMAE